jgi:hypothetical protein
VKLRAPSAVSISDADATSDGPLTTFATEAGKTYTIRPA